MRTTRTVFLDIAKAAAFGLALSCILLGVGLLRGLAYVLGGGKLGTPDPAELRGIAFYMGSLGTAGALLGAARPLLRTKVGVYAGLMAAGVVVVIGIILADRRTLAAIRTDEWWFAVIFGSALGAAGAYGWFRHDREAHVHAPAA